MLYFYKENTRELIETLSLEEVKWLVKFNIIKQGKTGFKEDDGVETLPFFDDYILTYQDALNMKEFSNNQINEMNRQEGFNSKEIKKFNNIINFIIENKSFLRVICS